MFSNWLPWTAQAFGHIWRARGGDTGLDLDAGERITRGLRASYQNAPVPSFNLAPVTGIIPLWDAEWLARYAVARPGYGQQAPSTLPPVVQTLSLPKQKSGGSAI